MRTISAQLHLAGCIGAIVALFFLLHFARLTHHYADFWACLIFGGTGILVFAFSSLLHFLTDGFGISESLERKFEGLDRMSIFLFIAGTYTPFILNVIDPSWQPILLWTIWIISLAGILYTIFFEKLPAWAQRPAVSTGLFLAMGWVLLVRIQDAIANLTRTGMWLLLAGAFFYSVGAVIFVIRRPDPFPNVFGHHEVWHTMVLAGFGCHLAMILSFYQRAPL